LTEIRVVWLGVGTLALACLVSFVADSVGAPSFALGLFLNAGTALVLVGLLVRVERVISRRLDAAERAARDAENVVLRMSEELNEVQEEIRKVADFVDPGPDRPPARAAASRVRREARQGATESVDGAETAMEIDLLAWLRWAFLEQVVAAARSAKSSKVLEAIHGVIKPVAIVAVALALLFGAFLGVRALATSVDWPFGGGDGTPSSAPVSSGSDDTDDEDSDSRERETRIAASQLREQRRQHAELAGARRLRRFVARRTYAYPGDRRCPARSDLPPRATAGISCRLHGGITVRYTAFRSRRASNRWFKKTWGELQGRDESVGSCERSDGIGTWWEGHSDNTVGRYGLRQTPDGKPVVMRTYSGHTVVATSRSCEGIVGG
jgi:hypothetical protein